MKLLFVCSRNQWRSRTAETLFARREGLSVRSAGTASSARIRVTSAMIDWADCILVMEHEHKSILLKRFSQLRSKRCIVLDIEDNYRYMDTELIELLNEAVEPIID